MGQSSLPSYAPCLLELIPVHSFPTCHPRTGAKSCVGITTSQSWFDLTQRCQGPRMNDLFVKKQLHLIGLRLSLVSPKLVDEARRELTCSRRPCRIRPKRSRSDVG